MQEYLTIFILILTALGFGLILIGAGYLFGPHAPNQAKNSPFECGFEEFEDARAPFDVRFYLVAILFILFDLEVAFFLPWVLARSELGWFGVISIGIFLTILMLGFLYEWKKGALEWE